MIYRAIAPDWLMESRPQGRRVHEGEFSDARLQKLNEEGYNIYFLPNYPSFYEPGAPVDGTMIDTFRLVFVDMDLKDGTWASKEAFIEYVRSQPLTPTTIVDSGNGVHVYWEVQDLDAMSFLRLQRVLCRAYKTDEAVSKIYQLMRAPGYQNTKDQFTEKWCEVVEGSEASYTCEEIARSFPPISEADEAYCRNHFGKTYRVDGAEVKIADKLPHKFSQLLVENTQVKELWSGQGDDRSRGDFKLARILHINGFTKEEALSTLVNCAKALERAPVHRLNYALNIVEKIWVDAPPPSSGEEVEELALSVEDLLNSPISIAGTRFPCHDWLDATHNGIRLTEVMGLVAGSGVGKTAIALNMFMGFLKNNPEFDHFVISLEQPAREIATRWKTMCGENTALYKRMYVIDNYNKDGTHRNLGVKEIETYVKGYEKKTGRKVGCIVIDHIGLLKTDRGFREARDSLVEICKSIKVLALTTNTFVIVQSQAPREKAGIGDLELNKDAAYGSVAFESNVDYLVTVWQPLKRLYSDPACPTLTAFKFCKIRHKEVHLDKMQEDVPYLMFFDPSTKLLRGLTAREEEKIDFWQGQAIQLRSADRKTDKVPYQRMKWLKEEDTNGEANGNQDGRGAQSA